LNQNQFLQGFAAAGGYAALPKIGNNFGGCLEKPVDHTEIAAPGGRLKP
jgi:hypothetical protein